jgi:hypothetical protein
VTAAETLLALWPSGARDLSQASGQLSQSLDMVKRRDGPQTAKSSGHSPLNAGSPFVRDPARLPLAPCLIPVRAGRDAHAAAPCLTANVSNLKHRIRPANERRPQITFMALEQSPFVGHRKEAVK